MKYYNYTKVGSPTVATDFPGEPNTLWEIDQAAGKLLAIIDPDGDEIQSSEDKGLTWSTEVSGTAGALLAVSSWHDRANDLLYTIESDLANDAETYVIDYSTWANITITKHNGNLGTVISSYHEGDIFLRDGNLEAVVCDNAQIDARRYNNPWASIDTNPDNIQHISSVVVVGTVAYFYGDNTAANTVGMYSFDGVTVDTLDIIAATSYSALTAGRNLAYDGVDTIYFIAVDDGTGDRYLYSYAITTDTITKRGAASYVLMRDRDTASGVKEKAWDWAANGFKVYQLHDVIKYQLHIIAKPAITADYKIYCLTDNFLWATKLNGDMASEIWEYEDQMSLVSSTLLDHEAGEASKGIITQLKSSIPIIKNMLMRFYYNYTTATATSEEIVFEGLITNFTEDVLQTITLVNPAKKEIKTILPSGDYTKDTDGLMSQLIIDYNNYATEGTLSDGGDLGTITLGGVHTEETIFDGCAKFDGFIWYFNPTGQIFYNNGTGDSGVNYTQANALSGVNISHVHEEYNKIKVRGAYVDGVQVESDWQEALDSQQALGINKRIFLISFLNTVALCNTAASNILTILAKDPLRVKFTVKDTTKGYVQVGETITFEYASSGKTVASDQFIITSATVNKYGDIRYTIVSELS